MHAFRAVGAFGVFLWIALPVHAQFAPTPATQACLDANPGLQAMHDDRGLVALYGVPFATDDPAAATTKDFVQAFLDDPANMDAMGVDNCQAEFVSEITIRNGKFTVFTYRQLIEGLPVHGSVVKIPVLMGQPNIISYIGCRLTPHPPAPLPGDLIIAQQAIDEVDVSATYGHLTSFSADVDAEHVIFEDTAGVLHRAWRFYGWDDDESYQFLVDTSSQAIVGAIDEILHFDPGVVTGTVSGYSTGQALNLGLCKECVGTDNGEDGFRCPLVGGVGPGLVDCMGMGATCEDSAYPCFPADIAENPPTLMTLPGIEVSLHADTDTDCSGAPMVPLVHADAIGGFSFSNVTLPVHVSTRLRGDSVKVFSCNAQGLGLTGCVDAALAGELDQFSVDSCDEVPEDPDPPNTLDVELNNATPAPEFDTAQVNAFIAIQKTHDWFKAAQPSYTAIDEPITCVVNLLEFCNGLYINSRESIVLGVSEGCNTAFSTILSHEYAHFIEDRLIESGGGDGKWKEGMADAIATYVWETPVFGLDQFVQGAPTFSRRVDVPDVRLDDTSSLPQWCDSGEHCEGLAIAGAFWDLREYLIANPPPGQLGVDKATELLVDFMFVTDGQMDASVILEVLIVDDDDGFLFDGPGEVATPNGLAIVDSFSTKHKWPLDTVLSCSPVPPPPVVEWDGVPGVNPQISAGDYSVYNIVPDEGDIECLPHVVLHTTEKGGLAVDRWRVGRVDGSGSPLDLGSVTATWAAPRDQDIIVEVGGTTPNPPCKDINVLDIPAQDTSFLSSITLTLTGDLIGRARSEPNSVGAGGQISGSVAGRASRVVANGIGTGLGGPGSFSVTDFLAEGDFTAIQPVSVLVLGGLREAMSIDQLDGIVSFSGDWTRVCGVGSNNGASCESNADCGGVCSAPLLTIGGAAGGDLFVAGDIRAGVTIDITANSTFNISVAGDIDGTVKTSGTAAFSGDICGANILGLTPGQEGWPENLDKLVFARGEGGGTVCQVGLLEGEEGFGKNRYLSFDTGMAPNPIAVSVTLVALPPPFDCLNGTEMWVGTPGDV